MGHVGYLPRIILKFDSRQESREYDCLKSAYGLTAYSHLLGFFLQLLGLDSFGNALFQLRAVSTELVDKEVAVCADGYKELAIHTQLELTDSSGGVMHWQAPSGVEVDLHFIFNSHRSLVNPENAIACSSEEVLATENPCETSERSIPQLMFVLQGILKEHRGMHLCTAN